MTRVPCTRAHLGDREVEAGDVVLVAAAAVRARSGDDRAGDEDGGVDDEQAPGSS